MLEQESQSTSSEQLDLVEQIERRIFLIRGHKVLLDSDLARLYGVSTGRLNEQVRRNHGRFPADFMFALTAGEADALRSQIAISKDHRGGRRYLPLVFTEQGVAMLSSVLNSERAIHLNIVIMRTFVRLRELQATYKDLADKLEELQEKYDDYRTRTTQSNSTQVSNACEENHCAGQTRSRRTRSPQSA